MRMVVVMTPRVGRQRALEEAQPGACRLFLQGRDDTSELESTYQ